MEKQRGATPHSRRRGMLTLEQLRVEVSEGNIDTVVRRLHRHAGAAGRASGSTPSYFLDDVAGHHIEGCNYLLAVDVEMNTVDGYAMSSWETRLRRLRPGAGHVHAAPGALARGHRDGAGRPDLARRRPGGRLAAADPQGADRAAGRARADRAGRHRARVRRVPDSYEHAQATSYRDLTPANSYNVDYSILGTARIEPLLRRLRQRHGRGRAAGGVGQGRVQPGPAGDRVPLRRGRHAPATTTPSTRPGRRRSPPRRA